MDTEGSKSQSNKDDDNSLPDNELDDMITMMNSLDEEEEDEDEGSENLTTTQSSGTMSHKTDQVQTELAIKKSDDNPNTNDVRKDDANHLSLPGLDDDADSLVLTKSTTEYTASIALQNHDTHRINPDKYFGLLRSYVRQDWHTVTVDDGIDELRAGWAELFFDLVFVACIVHLSAEAAASLAHDNDDSHRRLASDCDTSTTTSPSAAICHGGTYDFLFTTFAQFGILTNFWFEQCLYTTRFVNNQWIDEVMRVIYMTLVLSMGIFIQDTPSYHTAFMSSYLLLRFFSLLMYFKTLLIPRAKWYSIWYITQYLLVIILLSIILGINYEGCALSYFYIYLGFFLFEYIGGLLACVFSDKCKPSIMIPLNVAHISERYGLFVMIILGEALISVMTTDIGELNLEQDFVWETDGVAPDLMQIFFFLITFVISYCVGRLYFNCQPSEEQILEGNDNHALRISKRTGRMYTYAHQLLFFGLLGYGMGVKITGKHLLEYKQRWIDVALPGYSLVVIVTCLNLIRIAHPFNVHPKVWIFRCFVLVVMCIASALGKTINQGYIFVVMVLCIFALVIADFEGKAMKKHAKKEAKEKREYAKYEQQKEKQKQSTRPQYLRRVTSGIGLM